MEFIKSRLTQRIAVIVCAALGVIAITGQAQAATLLHEYTFSGDSVTDSVGSVNGSLENGATVSGGVLNLSGSAYAQLSGMIVPTGTTAFSVTFDAKSSSFTGTYAEMISQGFSGSAGFYIGYDFNDNFRLTDQITSTGVAFPTDGAFHNYALTTDASGTKFYIDASEVFSSSIQLTPLAGGTDTRFGSQFAPDDEYFQGQIDNVRIYDGVVGVAAVPEPEIYGMLFTGIGLLGWFARRRLPLLDRMAS